MTSIIFDCFFSLFQLLVTLACFDSTYLFGSILESFRKEFDLASKIHIILFPYLLYPFNQVKLIKANKTMELIQNTSFNCIWFKIPGKMMIRVHFDGNFTKKISPGLDPKTKTTYMVTSKISQSMYIQVDIQQSRCDW